MIRVFVWWSLAVCVACRPDVTGPRVEHPAPSTSPPPALEYVHDLPLDPDRLTALRRAHDAEEVTLEQRCHAGDDLACMQASRWIGAMTHEVANLVPRCMAGETRACRMIDPDDRPPAVRACTEPTDACARRLEANCARDLPESCWSLALRRHDRAMLQRASRLARVGCREGIRHECDLLGHSSSTPHDRLLAWSATCSHETLWCADAAAMLQADGDTEGARYLLELYCQTSLLCFELKELYRSGAAPEIYPGRLAELDAMPSGGQTREREPRPGDPEPVATSVEHATPRTKTAFRPRYALATHGPATELARQHARGVARDERACLTGETAACARAEPFSKDPRVIERARKGDPCPDCPCAEGNPGECMSVLLARGDVASFRRLVGEIVAACEAGQVRACVALSHERFTIPAATLRMATSEACQLGATQRCAVASSIFLAAGDPIAARYHLEVACQVFGACDDLWETYATGQMPELYPGRMRELEQQATRL